MGKRYASVFPDPVGAHAMISRDCDIGEYSIPYCLRSHRTHMQHDRYSLLLNRCWFSVSGFIQVSSKIFAQLESMMSNTVNATQRSCFLAGSTGPYLSVSSTNVLSGCGTSVP